MNGVGILLIVTGIILVLIGTMVEVGTGAGKLEYGGVIMLGPVPIAFGSSRNIAMIMLFVGVLFFIAWLFFFIFR